MRVAVTGASGFLGSWILQHLAEEGHELVATCRRPERLPEAAPGERISSDLLKPDSLREAFAGCDLVVHAGGAVSQHPKGASNMEAVHVTGTRNALQAALDAGVSRFVHISSSGTVAVSNDPHAVGREDDPDVLPVVRHFPYYRAKLFAEREAKAFEGVPVFVLNPTLMFGPGDVERRSVAPIQRYLDTPLPVAPPGGISFVDVRDVAAAVTMVLERGQPRRNYLLGSWNGSWLALYDRVSRIADLDAPLLKAPRSTRKLLGLLPPRLGKRVYREAGLQPHELALTSCSWMFDSARARRELKWVPRDPGETLSETVADLLGSDAG